jgi:opacity protein-like surface antigen
MKMLRSVLLVVMATMLAFTAAHAGFYLSIHGGPNFPTISNAEVSGFGQSYSGNLSPDTGFMLGAQLGYDFLSEAQNFPPWTQYLTLAFDFTGSNLSIPSRGPFSSADGGQLAWSFLVIGKLPLMKSDEFSKGRLFPYVGVGPSLVLTSFEDDSSFDVGIVVEPGVRFMFTRNFSGDLAYRFLYVAPSLEDGGVNVSWESLNHAIVFRLSFHF